MTAAVQTLEDAPQVVEADPPRAVREPWPEGRRDGKTLLAAAKEFQKEDRARSWFHFFETFAVFFALQAVTALAPTMGRAAEMPFWWAAALIAALVQGLVIVRLFIVYHDYMHLAILRNSAFAKWVMYAYGVYVLTPPNVWRQSHNYHHAHTAKIVGSHVGSYMMVTTKMWQAMTPTQRLVYKAFRHPLTVLFAYFTVFGVGMCVQPFMRNPKKNWDSLFALVVNVAVSIALSWAFGFWTFFFAYFLPLFVATATGAYLFYAQHDFPEINVQPRENWDYSRAALESSSYMELSPLMHWFTGNIGYHHVHHLNPGIPFYRLPEAMAAIPELQSPLGRTSLRLKDIRACFAQKLWDPETGRMVGYP
jgi:acyl-lipid omega-6 desaturase (Delta-12 desaturase)